VVPFAGNLAEMCIPEFLAELTTGWTHITLQQSYRSLTKQNTIPMKLYFEGPQPCNHNGWQVPNDMIGLSGNSAALQELQVWMSNRAGTDKGEKQDKSVSANQQQK